MHIRYLLHLHFLRCGGCVVIVHQLQIEDFGPGRRARAATSRRGRSTAWGAAFQPRFSLRMALQLYDQIHTHARFVAIPRSAKTLRSSISVVLLCGPVPKTSREFDATTDQGLQGWHICSTSDIDGFPTCFRAEAEAVDLTTVGDWYDRPHELEMLRDLAQISPNRRSWTITYFIRYTGLPRYTSITAEIYEACVACGMRSGIGERLRANSVAHAYISRSNQSCKRGQHVQQSACAKQQSEKAIHRRDPDPRSVDVRS